MFSFFVRLLKVYLWLHLFTKRRLNRLTDDKFRIESEAPIKRLSWGVLVNVKGNVARKNHNENKFC
jgi:hypothetical protein